MVRHDAATVSYSYHAPGLPHARDTVRKMAALARDASHTFPIRQLATRITHHVPSKQPLAELCAIYQWVRDNIRYRNDPHGLEWVQSPWRTLQERAGDCDDIGTFLDALVRALGRPTRYQIVGELPEQYNHVYLQAQLPDGSWITLDPVLEPPATSTAPRSDAGRFGWRAAGYVRTFDAEGREVTLGAPTTVRDRLLWQTVPYFPQVPPTGGYADPRNAGQWSPPNYAYRSAVVAGPAMWQPTHSGVMPWYGLGHFGQPSVPPEVVQAVSRLAPSEAQEALKEIGEAAAIIGAGSAVPIIGTAGGAIVAAVKILGPRVFKALASLFAGRENPWPKKIDGILRSSAPPLEKAQALEALRMVAAVQRGRGDSTTRRWARGAVGRVESAHQQLAAASPDVSAYLLGRVRVLRTRAQFRDWEPRPLQDFIAATVAVLRDPALPGGQRWQMETEKNEAIAAQKEQIAAAVAAERSAPAPRAPAPAMVPTTPAMWFAWLRAAHAAQVVRAPVPPPPLIPPPPNPPGLPAEWNAWLDHARAAQRAGRVPNFPPGIPAHWLTLGQAPLLLVPAAASLVPITAALGAIRPSVTFSLGHAAPGTAPHRHRLVLPSGEVVYTDKDALAGWYYATQSPVLGQVPGDFPAVVAAARAAVDAVAKHIRSRADKRPPGVSVPAVLAFQELDGRLVRDGLWGSNTQTAAAWYLGVMPAELPPTLPALRPAVTWAPPAAAAPIVTAPPAPLAPTRPAVVVAAPQAPAPAPVAPTVPAIVLPAPEPTAPAPPYVPFTVTPPEAPRVLETLPRELPPLAPPAPRPFIPAPPAPVPAPPPSPLYIPPAPVPPIPFAPPAPPQPVQLAPLAPTADTMPGLPLPDPGAFQPVTVAVPAPGAPDNRIWWVLGAWLLLRRRRAA